MPAPPAGQAGRVSFSFRNALPRGNRAPDFVAGLVPTAIIKRLDGVFADRSPRVAGSPAAPRAWLSPLSRAHIPRHTNRHPRSKSSVKTPSTRDIDLQQSSSRRRGPRLPGCGCRKNLEGPADLTAPRMPTSSAELNEQHKRFPRQKTPPRPSFSSRPRPRGPPPVPIVSSLGAPGAGTVSLNAHRLLEWSKGEINSPPPIVRSRSLIELPASSLPTR